ncbi:MAG: queuosine precursor transporter [Duncaniella sp.]|nr:queuosine precursor transporter [Duncaniella sp.]
MSKPSRHVSVTFMLLSVTFCVCIIVSNLVEIKTVEIGKLFSVTAGMFVFPISYILNDCIVEVYGFAKARMVIWLGFAMNLLVALLLQLAILLPGSEEWHGQAAMEMIYGAVPRIFIASFIAFLCGSMVNAYVMSRLKHADPEKGSRLRHSFSFRAMLSTFFGEGVDSLIFFPIAFAGVLSWGLIGRLILVQTLLKTLYELIILPVTVRVVRLLMRHEGDLDTSKPASYKWWNFKDLD